MLAKMRLLSAVVLTLTLPFLANASVGNGDAARISLPVVKRVNMTGSAKLPEIDRARVRALRARADGRPQADSPPSVNATNTVVTYVAKVTIGEGPTAQSFQEVLIDTGSSNTWVGAQLPYEPHKIPEGEVEVIYGSGVFVGNEYSDTVTLGDNSGLVIRNQSFGAATIAEGFDDEDGILGIGPTGLTEGTIEPPPRGGSVPTVTDNAFDQGLISEKVVCIAYAPAESESDTNGELTFGGSNPEKFTGSLDYVPITSTSPASSYVGINQTTAYGNATILNNAAGIVDTGTTLIYLPSDAYIKYQTATGATEDEETGLLKITAEQYDALEVLHFHIGGKDYGLTPNGQIWPRALNNVIGGEEGAYYLVIYDMGSKSGSGLDFIMGYTFLERFYHCYDSENNQAGFATTSFTNATTN